MAVDVTIKSSGLFKKQLTFQDILDCDIRYGVMDEAFRLDEGKIGENTVIFSAKHICRGYEVTLKKGEINLRMPLPTSAFDINFFYDLIKMICGKMNVKTFIRDDEKVTFDDIENCKKMDIQASSGALIRMEEDIDNGKYDNMYIFGAINPISIGKRELDKISRDVEKFGEVMNQLQTMDVYYAKASIYQRKDETYFGVYVLTEGVVSVLPYKAKLLMANNDLKVNDWNIGFVINGNLEGFIPYSDFLDSIDKTEDYDSEHFIITLDEKKMTSLLSKYRVDL